MTTPSLNEELITLQGISRVLPVFIVSVANPDGTASSVNAHASDDSAHKKPAVIIVHEIFGLNEHIKDIARRFARAGLIAVAPDLFAGAEGLPEDRNDLSAMRAVWQSIPDDHLISDLQSILAVATQNHGVHPEKVGTIGYCMGGAIALMFAGSTPQIAWVADYYGRIKYPQLSANKPRHPLEYATAFHGAALALFAGQDELIPQDQVAELEAVLKSNARSSCVKVYSSAQHAFFNDQRPFFNEEAATDAWRLTMDLIDSVNR